MVQKIQVKTDDKNIKILAMYLPQFYRTTYNDEWWGEGYTDWVAAKNAKSLFRGHIQPKTPMNDNYYDLSGQDGDVIRWQAELAKKYGIYGFCIYHYWFDGKKLLDTPVDILLSHPEIDIHFSLCWDSKQWTKGWYGTEETVLMPQEYGNEEVWKKHFKDMEKCFLDPRYIKRDNRPVFHIYTASKIPCLKEMVACWDSMAKAVGFKGIYIVACNNYGRVEEENPAIDAYYNFEPNHAIGEPRNKVYFKIFIWWKRKIIHVVNKAFHLSIFDGKRDIRRVYHLILTDREKKEGKKVFYGICPGYDDTPRKQEKGMVYCHASPALFERTLQKLINKSIRVGNEFIYINAWNEWGETAVLEPSQIDGYAYLMAVKNAMGAE
ncbi:MAG: glycoside hydrolase family 99-like domain-containing protein [Lachnospiraceae bacterium]|nr:glycoside hydrolase family 99-like domain-containing protein [Lachnospiraceae bacterium]